MPVGVAAGAAQDVAVLEPGIAHGQELETAVGVEAHARRLPQQDGPGPSPNPLHGGPPCRLVYGRNRPVHISSRLRRAQCRITVVLEYEAGRLGRPFRGAGLEGQEETLVAVL